MTDLAYVLENAEIKKTSDELSTDELPLDQFFESNYKYKDFSFYTIDIKHTPKDKLDRILAGCEIVEKACWEAQENFFDYARKRDLLTYIIHKGVIVAFQIASCWIKDNHFVYDLDETMVIKEFRGNRFAQKLTVITIRTFYLRMCVMKDVNRMAFIGITPNLRLINQFDKMRFLYNLLDNTFNPSNSLMRIHDSYIETKDADLVHEDYPFFLKSVFPGSLKANDSTVQKTSRRVQRMLPPGLDFISRGDAFLFLASYHKIPAWPIGMILMLVILGPRVLFYKNLGLFRKKKFSDINIYIVRK